jgi:hypothetical protein
MICSSTGWFAAPLNLKLRYSTRHCFFRQSFYLFPLHFFFTFFFPATLAPHHEQLAYYSTTLNDERRVISHSQHLVHLSPTLLTLTFFIIALLLLSRFNCMVTDIGSLVPELDGRSLESWIGPTDYEKMGKPLSFHCRFCSQCTAWQHCLFACSFDQRSSPSTAWSWH